MGKLIIDGNEVYEIDEECMKKKETEKKKLTAPEKGGQRHLPYTPQCASSWSIFYFIGKQFPVK